MKLSIEKSDLQGQIQHLYNIVPSKNTMPILTNYLIEANEQTGLVKFTATDLEITVVVEFPATVTQSGKVAVSAKNLNEIINSLPDAMVHIIIEEDNMKIQCDKSKFNLLCAESSQFPLVPQKDLSNVIDLDANMFKMMIENTSFAVSTETNRPIFTGIYWKMASDSQLMVATDGKKIAEIKLTKQVDIPESIEQIIPTKGLNFLDKVISHDKPTVSVLIESNRVMFSYGNYTIFTHIIEGRFPDYTKAIPANNTNKLVIDKTILKNAIKRVSLLASEDTFKVKLDVSSEKFLISSVKREEGEANELIDDYKFEGEALTIAFNYRYLIAIINVIDTKEVEICMGKGNEPALFFNTEKDEKFEARYLLMPLRLN